MISAVIFLQIAHLDEEVISECMAYPTGATIFHSRRRHVILKRCIANVIQCSDLHRHMWLHHIEKGFSALSPVFPALLFHLPQMMQFSMTGRFPRRKVEETPPLSNTITTFGTVLVTRWD